MAYILIGLAAGLALLLNGCSFVEGWMPRDAKYLPPYEGVGYTHTEPTTQEQILAASDFSVELVRFEDARYPRSTAFTAPDELLYEYEPDELMQGISYRVPVLMNKYLAYRPKMPKHYKVEMELLTFQTRIIGGTWKNGKFGRYWTRMEAKMVVRRPDSKVVLNRIYRLEDEQKRESFNGRNPTKEMDRGRMYDMAEAQIRRMAEETAWDIRRFDARRWNPEREAQKSDAISNEVKIRPAMPAKPKIQLPRGDIPTTTGDLPTTVEDMITPPAAPETPATPVHDSVQG